MTRIRTVLGDISPDKFGLALAHEHVLVDFIGADKASRERYNSIEVFDTMLPFLDEIRQLGVTGFVDCTPAFMARDSSLLAQLSRASGLHILTNTGLYKEPYLPRYAYEYSADELADLWVNEIEKGTDGTPIKAGFIKIAVNPGVILPIQQKIVRAAARCSRSTGAVIACHTVSGIAAKHLLEIINEEGLNPERLIVVHCDSETNLKYHLEIANQGAWVEYDAVREEYAERTLNLVKFIVDEGFEDRLLLSQDAGCYQVGEEKGGKIQSYAYLIRDFIPLMLRKGFKQELINKFLIQNPARAYKIESNL